MLLLKILIQSFSGGRFVQLTESKKVIEKKMIGAHASIENFDPKFLRWLF
jgi:hypothetical protein